MEYILISSGTIGLCVICMYFFFNNVRETQERENKILIDDWKHQISILENELTKWRDEANCANAELQKYRNNPSYDCQLLIKSLSSGSALLKIEAVDPNDLFIWKPGKS